MLPSLRPSRILVVEDEASIQLLIKAVLDLAGHEGHCVSSARDAIALLRQEPFHAVVTDLHLPGMSGSQLFERLRLDYPDLARRTIIVSAAPPEEIAGQSWMCLQHIYLQKPFGIDQLLAAVDKALDPRVPARATACC